MKLSEVIPLAYKKNWSYTNNYVIDIILTGEAFSKNDITLPRDLQLHVKNVKIPDFQNQSNSTWTMDRLRMYNGSMTELKSDITFLDHNDLELWRTWAKIWDLTQVNFPRDVNFDVKVSKMSETYGEDSLTHIVTIKNCLVENLGNFAYGTPDDPQVVQFNVSFRSGEYSLD